MSLYTRKYQVGLKCFHKISVCTRECMVVDKAEISSEFDELVCAFRSGSKEKIVCALRFKCYDRNLVSTSFLEKDGLLDGVIVEFVDNQAQPCRIQGCAAGVN